MARDLTPGARAHADTLRAEQAWVWLFEFFVPTTPYTAFRFTTYSRQVEYGLFSDGTPKVFYPAPVGPGQIVQSGDGDLPSISISLKNLADSTGKRVGEYVDEHGGLRDQKVTIRVLSASDLEAPTPVIEETGEVQSCTMTSDTITFRVSAQNLYRAKFPPYLFSKKACRWVFGSVECGYNVNASGAAYTECGYTLEDCELRGDDEESRGIDRKHPERWGNCPGIPLQGRR